MVNIVDSKIALNKMPYFLTLILPLKSTWFLAQSIEQLSGWLLLNRFLNQDKFITRRGSDPGF
jgi:hypothetical protein